MINQLIKDKRRLDFMENEISHLKVKLNFDVEVFKYGNDNEKIVVREFLYSQIKESKYDKINEYEYLYTINKNYYFILNQNQQDKMQKFIEIADTKHEFLELIINRYQSLMIEDNYLE